ncbi:Hypothetical protein NTJ_07418 [Nesidiocoris tenuis]|uniref:Uncharacterized protein n=1 Tax=Nesidiocoris tenuis TaxID=355587 RepID=A0ABN7AT13_9HEMI|nr:Hypothetical protein NTJ_07418 [Nesidiocoris tenuis]
MFNNLTLKATLRAEKDKEVIDTRRAGRYVKIRALLDSAESAIRSSNITRSLQNNLVGKVMRARKALDFGMNVPQVAENMALVVATLNQEIIEDQMAIDSINTDLRKDLDTFYNFPTDESYDFEKFVELDKKEKERYDPRGTRRGRRFSKSESSIDLGNEKSVSENDSKVENEHDPAENVKSGQDLTPKVSNVDGKSGDENADPIEDVWTINQTVDTLSRSLKILKIMPDLALNEAQSDLMMKTLKATKPLLLTPEGCASLSQPYQELELSIDEATDGAPKEPNFTQALVQMCFIISTHRETN